MPLNVAPANLGILDLPMHVPHQRQSWVRCEARHFREEHEGALRVVEAALAAKHAGP
jgi:hypothetical protein